MKGINFNTEMVQAILDGRKTQFRKICNQPRENACKDLYVDNYNSNPNLFAYWCKDGRLHDYIEPKYKIGDILYVRETFVEFYNACNCAIACECEPNIVYKADDFNSPYVQHKLDNRDITKAKWKPSIHMPKEYARIFLKVTNIRVERLQDISGVDIELEGATIQTSREKLILSRKEKSKNLDWWSNLWNSAAKDGYKWEDNPYVFVYEFEVVEESN